ncbi:MAG TPA: hypothetical protein PK504_06985 [Ferruginibacter sp.]|nr:hypothetical protein [Ferruginibacter sp.]HRE62794.1 hypothetical protein [Ferruginibacter sp.]
MKNKYILSVFVLGVLLLIISAMLKIMHNPGSEPLMQVSFVVIVIGVLLFIIKLLGSKLPFLEK